ncbi:hypothetical protein CEXT_340811 [Caerostris extrusa]|uniref:Uncharacterized protein n=1 Tax=Caerostris extrusa TaxID=172846 RepID=A0AAV4S845_CAEEX|nr:hypothetical protein CEXT_340811 [Caerostris extrusa]
MVLDDSVGLIKGFSGEAIPPPSFFSSFFQVLFFYFWHYFLLWTRGGVCVDRHRSKRVREKRQTISISLSTSHPSPSLVQFREEHPDSSNSRFVCVRVSVGGEDFPIEEIAGRGRFRNCPLLHTLRGSEKSQIRLDTCLLPDTVTVTGDMVGRNV